MDAMIAIGGDGTLTIARDLGRLGIPIVGVPKTIDNDLSATEVTFGFDTALHVATDAIDRLHTTAESHGRVMVIEVMGRDAGWIALHSGIAGGADVILIPEIPFTIETVCEKLRERDRHRKEILAGCCGGRREAASTRSVRKSVSRAASRPSGHSDWRRDPHASEAGCARHRAGPHSARRIAQPVRPHSGHAIRRGSRGAGCARRVRTNGVPAGRRNRIGSRSMKPSAKRGWSIQREAWCAPREPSASLSEINR